MYVFRIKTKKVIAETRATWIWREKAEITPDKDVKLKQSYSLKKKELTLALQVND